MLVACLTSLVALNGKNHAGTGNSAAFTVTQPLERAQNDAFVHPIFAQDGDGERRADHVWEKSLALHALNGTFERVTT